jgi:hypothetical protein
VIAGGDIAIYINGELRNDFYEERDIPYPGGCVKRFYFLTPVYPSDSGAEIRMERVGTTRRGFIYQDTFVAGSFGLDRYLMREYGLEFMLSEIVMIFSLVIVIISIVMRLFYKHRIEVLYGAMSILVLSGWLITNSFVYPFLYGHYHIDGIMNYILCLMMPFSLIFYLDALQHGRYRKVMTAVSCIAAVNLIVWPILHFTETFAFPRALMYIDAFLGIELLPCLENPICTGRKIWIGQHCRSANPFDSLLYSQIITGNNNITSLRCHRTLVNPNDQRLTAYIRQNFSGQPSR